MSGEQEVSSFVRSTFRSIWSLELLLFLKQHRGRSFARAEMVGGLRASELIVSQSVDVLVAAGLVSADKDGSACYMPASTDLEALVDAAEATYARSPDAVRRQIIASANGGLAAFADAFRLRKD